MSLAIAIVCLLALWDEWQRGHYGWAAWNGFLSGMNVGCGLYCLMLDNTWQEAIKASKELQKSQAELNRAYKRAGEMTKELERLIGIAKGAAHVNTH